jgi:hypothetical protein
MRDDTRRYSIEIKDAATEAVVTVTVADWTEDEKHTALAGILRLAGLPDDPGVTVGNSELN